MANSLITAGGGDIPAVSSPSAPAQEKPDRRVFMFRPGEVREFQCPEDVPAGQGWVDHPDKAAAAAPQEPAGSPHSEGNLTPIEKARAALAAKRARLKAEQEALEREEREAGT